MQTVIKDKDGNIINIGDWDCCSDNVTNENGEEVVVELNPMPEGAYEDTVEIVTGWDGGLYGATDPRRLKP